jgi:hypothetical protein
MRGISQGSPTTIARTSACFHLSHCSGWRELIHPNANVPLAFPAWFVSIAEKLWEPSLTGAVVIDQLPFPAGGLRRYGQRYEVDSKGTGSVKERAPQFLRCGEHTSVMLKVYGRQGFTELGRNTMLQAREDLLVKADEFERLAAGASSEALRCRYMSLARYWAILADESADFIGHGRAIAGSAGVTPINRPAA